MCVHKCVQYNKHLHGLGTAWETLIVSEQWEIFLLGNTFGIEFYADHLLVHRSDNLFQYVKYRILLYVREYRVPCAEAVAPRNIPSTLSSPPHHHHFCSVYLTFLWLNFVWRMLFLAYSFSYNIHSFMSRR